MVDTTQEDEQLTTAEGSGKAMPTSPTSPPASILPDKSPVLTIREALDALIATPPGADEQLSTACNSVERAMYGVNKPTESDLLDLEPLLLQALNLHLGCTDAHLTVLEVIRKLCESCPLKLPELVPAVTSVLRNSRTESTHKLTALGTLAALCSSYAPHRDILLNQAENVRAIARVMRSFEQLPSAQNAGLCALFASTDGDCHKPISRSQAVLLVNTGAARGALRMLRVHPRRPELVATALNSISSLCHAATKSAHAAMRDAGAARAAVDALVVHERDPNVALASVVLLRSLGPSVCTGAPNGVIPRAVLSAMCAFRSERRIHVAGLGVLAEMANNSTGAGDTARQVSGAGAAQVILTTMIEYRTDTDLQLACVEILREMVAQVGKDKLECNAEDIRSTVSGCVRLYLHNQQLMECTAQLLKSLK